MNLHDNKELRWKRFVGNDHFDYPIDYSAALLRARDDGHVLFNLYAPDGLLAQSLASDGTVIGESTLDQILKGKTSREPLTAA